MPFWGTLLDDFALRRSDIHFKIPTLSTSFINNAFGKHPITPMGMLPWNLAMKNLGLPMLRAMTQTNLVLITDNILFDRKFHNPFVNNLNAISLFAPLCKKKNIPIVFYNCSIGPIERKVGINALQKVLNASPLVITRDPTTEALLHRLPLTHPEIKVHADCALNTPIPSDERMNEIIQKEGLFTNSAGTIGMNVNAYIDDFNETGSFDRETFCKIIAGTADKLIETLGVDILFTVSQIMDMKITKECLAFSKHQDCIKVVGNCDYTYEELTGLLSKVEIHAGLRDTYPDFLCGRRNPHGQYQRLPQKRRLSQDAGHG